MKELADLAADDSPAQVYAKMQYAIIVAQQESYGGGMTGPQVMRTTDDGEIELSSEPMGFEGDIEATTLFSDFQLTDGKLASFSVATPDDDDEAEPISIDERVVSGGQRQNIAGNTVRLMGAYHSVQSDSVFVVISTEATGDGMEYSWNNAYVTDDGREVAGAEALGNDQPRKGRESPYVVTFDAVDLGGTAEIGVYTADYNEATLKFDLEPSF